MFRYSLKRRDQREPFSSFCKEPDFFQRVFLTFVEEREREELARIFDLQQEAELSLLCDRSGLQDSFLFRCQRRARLLSAYLIDDEGELQKERLEAVIAAFEKAPYIPFPKGNNDGMLNKHQLRFLKRLKDDLKLWKWIKKFQRPLCHKWAETLVRDAVGLSYNVSLKDASIREAVLAACLGLLRQSVGSCFATAPAILIHDEQVDHLLADLYEMLMTGKLKRTFGGVEYTVPLCPSSGLGDLKKSVFSKNGEEKIWFSPGLIAAFESVGLIDPKKTRAEKIELQSRLIFPFLQRGTDIDVGQLIHQIVLAQSGITEEELEASEKRELAMAIRGNELVSLSKTDAQAELVRHKELEAKAVFKAFSDHPLLKTWEYTLASFSEVKMEFSRWNLYSSLGFHHEEKGGIGQIVYRYVEEKLGESNQKSHEYHQQYEIAFDQLRATEILLKQASSESDIRRLRAEYQSRAYHLQSCLEMRDRHYSAATRYSTFFSFLMEQYDAKFKEYFQEIYDPEMRDLKVGQYDDSPAGFRLVYKHGRSDASLWTSIHNSQQWIEALVDFFQSTESLIASLCPEDNQIEEVRDLTTEIISHIRTEEFLETAIIRMAKAHQISVGNNPLENLDRMEKKPWAYTSGGTMETLLRTYYKRESPITEEARWVESPSDLVTFILDVLKNQPPLVMDKFIKDPDRGMLIYSPTHAFILHPGWDFIKEGWKDEGFTYTWVRDRLIKPRQEFYARLSFSFQEQFYLAEQFCGQFLPLDAHRFKNIFDVSEDLVSVKGLRQAMIDALKRLFKGQNVLESISDKVDSFLYESLPLTRGDRWKMAMRDLLGDLLGEKLEDVLEQFADTPCEWMSSKVLQEAAKGCALLEARTYKMSIDLHRYVALRAQQKGHAAPTPLLFADTNWAGYAFGFAVNPGTGLLELWRMDFPGSSGTPMSSWKTSLDGSKKLPWGICVRPYEYGC